MRAARMTLGACGVAGIVWGAWLLSDDGLDRLQSTALWLVGVVVLHDAVLAPVVVALGVVAAKALPRQHRVVAAVAFLVWGRSRSPWRTCCRAWAESPTWTRCSTGRMSRLAGSDGPGLSGPSRARARRGSTSRDD